METLEKIIEFIKNVIEAIADFLGWVF